MRRVVAVVPNRLIGFHSLSGVRSVMKRAAYATLPWLLALYAAFICSHLRLRHCRLTGGSQQQLVLVWRWCTHTSALAVA
jgi:hypothetical protein